jgi:hypothetical protein
MISGESPARFGGSLALRHAFAYGIDDEIGRTANARNE